MGNGLTQKETTEIIECVLKSKNMDAYNFEKVKKRPKKAPVKITPIKEMELFNEQTDVFWSYLSIMAISIVVLGNVAVLIAGLFLLPNS